MPNQRLLLISGFDPSGGAGMIADVKAAEFAGVLTQGIITANTIQVEDRFVSMGEVNTIWEEQLNHLFKRYSFEAVKIGLVPSIDFLIKLLEILQNNCPKAFVIWDPILKATFSESNIHEDIIESFGKSYSTDQLKRMFSIFDLITPNIDEAPQVLSLLQALGLTTQDLAVLIKSFGIDASSSSKPQVIDLLDLGYEQVELKADKQIGFSKRGTGCSLSTLIACAQLKKKNLKESCSWAQKQMERYICSNQELIGTWK